MVSILHREMRIASRRRWTFWSRVVTSVFSFVCGMFLILISAFQGGVTGSYLFLTLVFVSFCFCLIQGVRHAAASVSDEKRDGTLGLLFLTDLRPIDIIAGKLFAVAIPLIQPLLAFLPVLAISVLLGGITGGEIFRAALTLGSILLYSIAAGLFVSSVSRKSEETGQSTIFLLLAILALPRIFGRGQFHALRYLSPWTAYANISDPGYRVNGQEFLYSLLVTNLFSVGLLLGSGFFIRRRWEDRPTVHLKSAAIGISKPRISSAKRAALLDRNPGEWLAARHAMGPLATALFILLSLAVSVFAAFVANSSSFGGAGGPGKVAALIVLTLGGLLILVRLASQASYSLAEARQSGAIEMMISTPMDPKCLITGQVASLGRQFLAPLGMLLIASVFIVSYEKGVLEFAGSILMIGIFWGALTLVTATVAAFGMWMGLREKTPNAAFFKTLIFTILPIIFGWCMVFVLLIGYIILLLVSISQLTGRDLRRLLRNEKKISEMTPVAPIVPAPPIIKT
jgi:hypothetical protein